MHYAGPIDAVRKRRRIVAGVGVSLLLHAALLYGWRHARPPAPPEPGTRVESLTVWIRPPALKAPPPPPVASAPPRREPRPVRAPRSTVASPAAAPMPAGASSATAQPAITMLPAPPAENSPAPKFDMEAARSTARKMASERDPSKVGTAVGQIPDKPLQTETQLARDIAQGKRGDCRTAYAGAGLLAPVIMLLDKNDSGCKW